MTKWFNHRNRVNFIFTKWTMDLCGDMFFGSTGSFGDLGVEFTGSLQEIRYYNSPLTESALNNHTK